MAALVAKVGSVAPADSTPLELLDIIAPMYEGLVEPTMETESLVRRAAVYFERPADAPALTVGQADDLADILMSLEDGLNEVAPPFCYFGQWNGDEDYGFWPAIEEIEGGNVDGVMKVSEIPSYFMQVNDHGNVTLYEVTVKEIWSVV